MMNPGYISLWFFTSLAVLMLTGWREIILPDVSRRVIAWLSLVLIGLFLVPIWWTPFSMQYPLHISAAVAVCMLACVIGLLGGTEEISYKGYLLLCVLMVALVWGMVRKIYHYDPVLFMLHPQWDAPLLSGLLCGAFTARMKHQLSILAWGAVLGEGITVWLKLHQQEVWVGSLSWWDSFSISAAAAFMFSLLLRLVRFSFSKCANILLPSKDGSSS